MEVVFDPIGGVDAANAKAWFERSSLVYYATAAGKRVRCVIPRDYLGSLGSFGPLGPDNVADAIKCFKKHQAEVESKLRMFIEEGRLNQDGEACLLA